MHLPIWRLFQNIPRNLAKKNPLRLPAIMPGLRLQSNSYGCCYGWVSLGFKPREYQLPVSSPRDTGSIYMIFSLAHVPYLVHWIQGGLSGSVPHHFLSVWIGWYIPENRPGIFQWNAVRPAWKLAKQGRSFKFIIDFWLYILSTLHVSRTSRQKEFFSSFIHQSEKKPPLSSFGNDCTTRPGVSKGIGTGMLKWAVIDLIHILWLVRIGRRSKLRT